jgi:ribosomal protein L11 methyltransferase
MNTIQLSIKATEEQQEILISQLQDTGASGFEQKDHELVAYFPEKDFNQEELDEVLRPYTVITSRITEQNWNALWESNFEPVVVGDFCYVRAHFHKPLGNTEHEIIITPKMSFGTGHHATTYMMMEQMKDLDFKEKSVFDFGTGTGILAILSEKLGAAEITAIDVDDWSIENAKENAERNGCSCIDVSLSSGIPAKNFDIILANINRNVIVQYLPQLKNHVISNGILLLSGLMKSDEDDIVEAWRTEGFRFIKQSEKGAWISLLFMNSA